MNTSLLSIVRSHRFLFALIIAASVLCISAFAFAAIVSGGFQTASSVQVTTTTLTINKPATSAGDFMIATIAIYGGSSATISSVPAGWTQIARTDNDATLSVVSYWKIDTGSEPSSYEWVIDGQTTAEGGIVKYSGVDATSPIDASAGNTGLGVTATTSAITTTAGNDEVIAVFAVDEGKTNTAGSYFATSTGMMEKFDVSNTPYGPSLSVQDAVQATAGTAASKSSAIGAGNKAKNWATQQIALRLAVPAITFDNITYTNNYNTSQDTVPLTVGSGANRMLLVSVLVNPPAPPYDIVSNVTYASVQATQLAKTFYTRSPSR